MNIIGMKKGIVTAQMLKKTYGQYYQSILASEFIEHAERKKGEKRKFNVKRELPTIDDFQKLLTKHYTITVADAVGDAFSEIQDLTNELQDWYDNLPEAFQNGGKGDELQEAISALESAQEPSLIPDEIGELSFFLLPDLDRSSRPKRCSAAMDELNSIAEFLRDQAGEVTEPKKGRSQREREHAEEQANEMNELADELENTASELENVVFPGMY